jgi:hypothetical protein
MSTVTTKPAPRQPDAAPPWRSAPTPAPDAPVHPAATVFPALDPAEYEALRDDVKRNGVIEPIFVDAKGRVLDGRHRLRAAHEAGRPCAALVYDGPDPVEFVLSMNLHRRHLTEGQRAMIAERLANLGEGRPRAETGSRDPVSITAAAKLMRVSPSSVKRARVVRLHGSPALGEAVTAGAIPLKQAAREAKPPKVVTPPPPPKATLVAPVMRDPMAEAPEVYLHAVVEMFVTLTTLIKAQELRDLIVEPDERATLWRHLEIVSSWVNLAVLTPPAPEPAAETKKEER